eukprot:scaffold912_cov119-Cylindrotheca_fusiformis.AAC.21
MQKEGVRWNRIVAEAEKCCPSWLGANCPRMTIAGALKKWMEIRKRISMPAPDGVHPVPECVGFCIMSVSATRISVEVGALTVLQEQLASKQRFVFALASSSLFGLSSIVGKNDHSYLNTPFTTTIEEAFNQSRRPRKLVCSTFALSYSHSTNTQHSLIIVRWFHCTEYLHPQRTQQHQHQSSSSSSSAKSITIP